MCMYIIDLRARRVDVSSQNNGFVTFLHHIKKFKAHVEWCNTRPAVNPGTSNKVVLRLKLTTVVPYHSQWGKLLTQRVLRV